MIDLQSTFPSPTQREAAILAAIDHLCDQGLDRARIEPSVRASVSALDQIHKTVLAFTGEANLTGHEATLARVLLMGGLTNWCDDMRLSVELGLTAYISKYATPGA